jgi:hypothetical protein
MVELMQEKCCEAPINRPILKKGPQQSTTQLEYECSIYLKLKYNA